MLVELKHNHIKDIILQNDLVLIDYFTRSDTLSEMLYNVMIQVRRNLANHIYIGVCHIDDEKLIKEKIGLKDLPAVILYKNGIEVAKMTGFRRASSIIDKVNEYDM